MEPVKLTMKQVLVAARKAMEEGRLGKYSNPRLKGGKYLYKNGHCCVVGAAMSDEDAHRFGKTPISNLVARTRVQVPTGELEDMQYLQRAHDDIGMTTHPSYFLKAFERLEAKYGAR